MDTVHVNDLRMMAEEAKRIVNQAIDCIIKAIDTKILVGDINRPAEKKPRKKRTRKVKVEDFPPHISSPPDGGLPSLAEKDDHPFYGKKRGRKKKEVTVPAEE